MRVFFDTEFTGLRRDTTLVSIGMVAEDGKTLYAELADYERAQCDDWIEKNVIAHLEYNGDSFCMNDGNGNTRVYGSMDEVREAISTWVSQYDDVQLVSDVCHYDMVLFIDLFGDAFSLPRNVCASCHDINQDIAKHFNVSEREAFDMSREGILEASGVVIGGHKHNALHDAKAIREIFNIVCQ